jgi:signal transduction histidine kinase
MEAVEKAGRQALTEMRHLLDVLRPGRSGEELGPQPGVAELARLVNEVRDAGLQVELNTEGPLKNLPARVGLAVYRIVQEALTNVLKHAGPDPRVKIFVHVNDSQVELSVLDDGQGPQGHDGGHGIAGMRERAELLGGKLTAGAGKARGFEVRASLPIGIEP